MGTYSGSAGFEFYLDNTESNKLVFRGTGSTVSNYPIAEDGNRKHVAYVRSGALGTFYVDGIQVATGVATAMPDGGNLVI